MDAKLTLRLDEAAINRAKAFARAQGRSVSEIVEVFFLTLGDSAAGADQNLGPVTRRLAGLLKGTGLDEADYKQHLASKHGL